MPGVALSPWERWPWPVSAVVLCISPCVTFLRLNPVVLVGNSPEALLPPVEPVLDAPMTPLS